MSGKPPTLQPSELESGDLADQAISWPFVSVIVPCRNEEKHIARCLDSILANDYPSDRLEVLVVDGMSEDGTRAIVQEYTSRYRCLRLVDNPKRHIPGALNLGIQNAQGDTVVKMDAHSIFQSDHISQCVRFQEDYGAENVGGILNMLPGSNTGLARAIALAMAHRFGSGNARIKIGVEELTWSDSAAFGCFRKELFNRVGLFDERLKTSSDMDMNMRIRDAGGGVLLVPQIVVNYYADPTLKKFWKHNFADGVWATYVLEFGSKGWSWRHWVPLGFVLSLLTSFTLAVFLPVSSWLALGIAGLYAAANLAASLQIAIRERSLQYFFLLPFVFGTRHIAHGLGALLGVVLVVLPGQIWKGRRGFRA